MRLVHVWLCGDDDCKGELERELDRHAYRCPECGKSWDAMQPHLLNWTDRWEPLVLRSTTSMERR